MNQDRRAFLKQSVKGITFCCTLSHCPQLLKADSEEKIMDQNEAYMKKVSEDITYCAYRCNKNCPWLVASLNNDQKKLQELANKWSENHDNKKMPESGMFCFGCRPIDKPMGHIVSICTVRQCAIEKKLSNCVECNDLATCDKDLWNKYPSHRQYVLKLQKGEREPIK